MTPADIGEVLVLLQEKVAADAELSYSLTGKLYLSHSGWLLLSVPNDLGIGAFKALNETGAELPVSKSLGRYNAHISVMSPKEVERIGAKELTERGKEYSFTLGPVRVVEPTGHVEMDRCWFIEVRSPELEKLRKSYGLSALPNDDEYKFHITFALRRRKVLRPGDIIKGMGGRGSLVHNPQDYVHKAAEFFRAKQAVNRNQQMKNELAQLPDDGFLGAWYSVTTDQLFLNFGDWADKETIDAYRDAFSQYADNIEIGDEAGGPGPGDWVKLSAVKGVEVKESPIDGKGLFASRNFEPGDLILAKAMVKFDGEGGLTRYDQSTESRFTNHSGNPNAELRHNDGRVALLAARPITAGEEITGDYGDVGSLLGPGFYFTYEGKPYNGESTSGQHLSNDGPRFSGTDVPELDGIFRALGQTNYNPLLGVARSGDDPTAGRKGNAEDTATRGVSAPGESGEAVGRPGDLHAEALSAGSQMAGSKQGAAATGREESRSVPGAAAGPDLALRRLSGSAHDGQGKQAVRLPDKSGSTGSHGVRNKCGAGLRVLHQLLGDSELGGAGNLTITTAAARAADIPFRGTGSVESCGILKQAEAAGASLAVQIANARRETAKPKSESQADAGNYRKGKVVMHGLTISLENPKGSTRSGTAPDGKKWSTKMKHDYGYINRTSGNDGDHVDVFLGGHHDSDRVFVVNQIDPKTKQFDEHKCMLGFKTEADARKGYFANYEDGWQGLGSIKEMSVAEFKDWVAAGKTTKQATDWAKRLDNLILRRDPDGISQENVDVALRATPLHYDMNQNVASNFLNHMRSVRGHANKQVQQTAQHERFLNAANPDRGIREFQRSLSRKPDHGRLEIGPTISALLP